VFARRFLGQPPPVLFPDFFVYGQSGNYPESQSGQKLCSGLELAQKCRITQVTRARWDLPIRAIVRERENTMPGIHYLAVFVAAVAAFVASSVYYMVFGKALESRQNSAISIRPIWPMRLRCSPARVPDASPRIVWPIFPKHAANELINSP
jgi:hypothetical protein